MLDPVLCQRQFRHRPVCCPLRGRHCSIGRSVYQARLQVDQEEAAERRRCWRCWHSPCPHCRRYQCYQAQTWLGSLSCPLILANVKVNPRLSGQTWGCPALGAWVLLSVLERAPFRGPVSGNPLRPRDSGGAKCGLSAPGRVMARCHPPRGRRLGIAGRRRRRLRATAVRCVPRRRRDGTQGAGGTL